VETFATGYGFYKLFWVFLICGTVGIGIEYLYVLVSTGHIVNRTGVLYGQFSQVYGLGGVLMVLILTRIRHPSLVFLTSAFLGGVYEYSISWFQEITYGSTGWDYSNTKYNLQGRTSLLFMLYWGVLGLLFAKYLYPALSRFIERFPSRIARPVTRILLVFMILNLAISTAALVRSSERYHQVPATNMIRITLDKLYPDEIMRAVYPDLKLRN
jgi:uncharacterized membrane protein